MTIYFGFIPTPELNQQLDDVIDMVANRPEEAFYPRQLEVTNQIAHEILENLFVKLVEIIDDPKRKEKMKKVVANIHSAVDSMLKHIIVEHPNDKVEDAFKFLLDDCLFTDNDGIRRVGFLMPENQGQKVVDDFATAKTADDPHDMLIEVMDIIIETNLDHYLTDFSKHLHLGMLKRKAIPLAETAINKASSVAIHKLLPDMDNDACKRLVTHFEQFIIVKA
ncbi:MAG: hypothetical protein CR966_00280 [Pseudomonadales bacterium]|nr:MAG: hypothetical protein CR966_00280 [Pseudomonadales bacterium]